MNPTPTVTVIMPTRNGAKTIATSISSILSQTFKSLSLTIIDDNGDLPDAKAELRSVLESTFSEHLASGKIHVMEGRGEGPGKARDAGIRASSSPFIAFLDDDDQWSDADKLEKQIDLMNVIPELGIVGTQYTKLMHENGTLISTVRQPLQDAEIREQMLMRNPFTTSSVLLKRDAYIACGGFKAMYLAEDYDLFMKIGLSNQMANVPDCSISYAVRATSASNARKIEMSWTVLKLVYEYRLQYPNRYKALIKAVFRVIKTYVEVAIAKTTKMRVSFKVSKHT